MRLFSSLHPQLSVIPPRGEWCQRLLLKECFRTPVLAVHLLGSLPLVLHDEDEGIAEALRRNAEFEANPSLGMSLEELDQGIESRRS